MNPKDISAFALGIKSGPADGGLIVPAMATETAAEIFTALSANIRARTDYVSSPTVEEPQKSEDELYQLLLHRFKLELVEPTLVGMKAA